MSHKCALSKRGGKARLTCSGYALVMGGKIRLASLPLKGSDKGSVRALMPQRAHCMLTATQDFVLCPFSTKLHILTASVCCCSPFKRSVLSASLVLS